MSVGRRTTRELGLGEVIEQTFQLYRQQFATFAILFVVTDAIFGILITVFTRTFVMPLLPANPTPQQFGAFMTSIFGSLVVFLAIGLILALVLLPITQGSAVKMSSDLIETGRADLAAAVKFAVSKMLWIWVVGLVVGIISIAGFFALVIPGIILSLMFSLWLPATMIEGSGFHSLGRSRKLVSKRWLKTLGLLIIIGLIQIIADFIASEISGFFGTMSTLINAILVGFVGPVSPIALTVYYYSNVARLEPQNTIPPPVPASSTGQAVARFCPSCGTQVSSDGLYCPNCGTKISV